MPSAVTAPAWVKSAVVFVVVTRVFSVDVVAAAALLAAAAPAVAAEVALPADDMRPMTAPVPPARSPAHSIQSRIHFELSPSTPVCETTAPPVESAGAATLFDQRRRCPSGERRRRRRRDRPRDLGDDDGDLLQRDPPESVLRVTFFTRFVVRLFLLLQLGELVLLLHLRVRLTIGGRSPRFVIIS